MLYSCKEKKATNEKQLALVKKHCRNKDACQIEVTRDFFGNSECPGTDDADMNLWLIYSCNDGGSDKTTSHKPKCDGSDDTTTTTTTLVPPKPPTTGKCDQFAVGKMIQMDLPGCGGSADIVCTDGCINVHKVTPTQPPLFID